MILIRPSAKLKHLCRGFILNTCAKLFAHFYRGIRFFALTECVHSPPLTTSTKHFNHCTPPRLGGSPTAGGYCMCHAFPLFFPWPVSGLAPSLEGHRLTSLPVGPCCHWEGLDVTGLGRCWVGYTHEGGYPHSPLVPHLWLCK